MTWVANFKIEDGLTLVIPFFCFIVNRRCTVHLVTVGRVRQVARRRITAIACRSTFLFRVSCARTSRLIFGCQRISVRVVAGLAGLILVASLGLPSFILGTSYVSLQGSRAGSEEMAYAQFVRGVYHFAVRMDDIRYRFVIPRDYFGASVNNANLFPFRYEVSVDNRYNSLYVRASRCVIRHLSGYMDKLVEMIAGVVIARSAM